MGQSGVHTANSDTDKYCCAPTLWMSPYIYMYILNVKYLSPWLIALYMYSVLSVKYLSPWLVAFSYVGQMRARGQPCAHLCPTDVDISGLKVRWTNAVCLRHYLSQCLTRGHSWLILMRDTTNSCNPNSTLWIHRHIHICMYIHVMYSIIRISLHDSFTWILCVGWRRAQGQRRHG